MKILLTILLFCISFITNAQYQFHAPPLAAPNTDVKSRGGIGADSSIAWYGSYADTTSANAGVVDGIPGAVIRTVNRLWLRNSTATAWIPIGDFMATDTTNKWIWAQGNWNNMTRQTRNTWYDSTKLRYASIANEDSAHFDWWWKGDGDDSWTYFTPKNFFVSDNDSVADGYNDDWPYGINTNALVQRVTRLNPAKAVGYRFNLMAHQIFTNGADPASMALLGGDAGAAFYAKLMLKENAGYTGRTVINGGSPSFNATPGIVSIVEFDGFTPAHVNATGYWAGYNSTVVAGAGDSVEHFIHYNSISYLLGTNGVKTETGFYIDYTGAVPIPAKWGVYSADGDRSSFNRFDGRVGIGGVEFGTHETPTFKNSAALQINSHNRGFITSRMTAAERIAIAADTALFVWDSDSLRYFGYQPGTGWRGVAWTGESGGGGFFSPDQTSSAATTHDANGNNFTINDMGQYTINLGASSQNTVYADYQSFGVTIGTFNPQAFFYVYNELLPESVEVNMGVTGASFSRLFKINRDDGIILIGGGQSVLAVTETATRIEGKLDLTDDITTAPITSNQNDYNPTDLTRATALRLSSDASRDITGLQGVRDGRVLILHNVGSNPIVLKDESLSSTDAYRFALSADVTLNADQSMLLQYDTTSARWRAVSFPPSDGGTVNTGASGKATYYPSAGTTVDDFVAVDYSLTGTNVKFTQQNTTDVIQEIKAISSTAADYWQVSTSAGTGNVAKINSAGEMIFGGMSDAGAFQLQLNGKIYMEGGASTNYLTFFNTGASNSYLINEASNGNFTAGTPAAYISHSQSGASMSFLISTNDVMSLNATGLMVGNNFASHVRRLDVVETNLATNAIGYTQRSYAYSSGTPVAGFGVGQEFAAYLNAGVKVGASFDFPITDVTSTSEDFDFVVKLMAGGSAAAEKLRVTSLGSLIPSGRIIQLQGADVASVAGAIALGTDGNAFEITGTNAITLISNVNWQNGAVVTLAFTSTATLTDGTANSGTDIGLELAGNTNFVASAGATVTLRLIEVGGTQRWREISRSVN